MDKTKGTYSYIQKISHFDTANGPGIRTTLWFSGCSHHCRECHNPQTWDPRSGRQFTADDYQDILTSLASEHIMGLTLSGGDPLYVSNRQLSTCISMCVKNLYPNKTIWCYTGYLYEEVKHLEIMNYIDVLVDGKFEIEKKDMRLKFCGSTNQRVIDVQKTIKSGSGSVVLYQQ